MRSSPSIFFVVAAVMASNAAAQFVALDASEAVTFFVAKGTSGKAHPDAELARWALDAWSKATDGALTFVETEAENEARVRIYWAGSDSGRYGGTLSVEMNGKAGALVYINTASDGLGEDIHRRAQNDQLFRDTIVYLTCVHEIGHAIGLTHTDNFRDIMYTFQHGGDIKGYFQRYRKPLRERTDLRTLSPFSDNDLARLHALY